MDVLETKLQNFVICEHVISDDIRRPEITMVYLFVIHTKMHTESTTWPFDSSTLVARIGDALNIGFNVSFNCLFIVGIFSTHSTLPRIACFSSNFLQNGNNPTLYIFYVGIYKIINRPGVTGAVLQSPPLLINSFIDYVILCETVGLWKICLGSVRNPSAVETGFCFYWWS